VYPHQEVAAFVTSNFVPIRIDVRKHGDLMPRFGAQWTPTVLVMDSDGVERHRIEGFLPVPDFLANLEMGLARVAFGRQQWAEAEQRYRDIVDRYPNTDWAPESLYWAGVAKYKGSSDPKALAETAKRFTEKYQDTSWAKKSSVWSQ
jgi:tetratricopeptide repeat protein